MAVAQREKRIADLGLAAWIKMHGYQISKVESNCVFFQVENDQMIKEVEALETSYVNSEACSYDSWLMSLKQMPVTDVNECDPEIIVVEGLGPSAFLRHKGRWRLIGRPHHIKFAFYVPSNELTEFNSLRVAWTNSDLRDFDAAMMAIKSLRVRNNRR